MLLQPFVVPKDNEVSYDVIRKNKNIGSLTSKFVEEDDKINFTFSFRY